MQDQTKFIANVAADGMLDVSSEKWRTYHYPGDVKLTILNPVKLHVKRRDDGSDSHRLIDTAGCGWYVRPGWLAIQWSNGDDPVKVNF